MKPRLVRLHSANNDFQRLEVLRRNRQKRHHYRQFFLEGVRPINLALKYGWQIEAFAYDRDRSLSDWATGILDASQAATHFELPHALMAQLSGKVEPSELIAVVAMSPDDLNRIELSHVPSVVVFDRPSSPGNLGSLIRSCDALGIDGAVVVGHGVDIYDPETVTASRGSLFALPVVHAGGMSELQGWLDTIRATHSDLQIVALEEEAEVDLWQVDFTRPLVLVLGNEKWGLSATLREIATVQARIPMDGAASSLNVAAAGSIALYEMTRQRTVSTGHAR
jgi:23S rRNA (uridine2479-2'-O)-methyltransferase